ncbi:superinfection immunity protein [uncultured Aquitalea sp.]|uniref:superinfection immunity protein n=1 Tax=uncultured Aquitalea sp. TaxID=540272 RepID=UPI0025D8C05B|nr:superinfection immunity protein [uncultured Aquitalea sp.]
MKVLELIKLLAFGLLGLSCLLWVYGTFAGQPGFVDIAIYIGDAVIMTGAYLIPSFTAALVKTPRLKLVVLINVLGGWLILPWIIAMGMALKRDDLREQH